MHLRACSWGRKRYRSLWNCARMTKPQQSSWMCQARAQKTCVTQDTSIVVCSRASYKARTAFSTAQMLAKLDFSTVRSTLLSSTHRPPYARSRPFEIPFE